MKINLNHPITVTLTEKGMHFLENHIGDIPYGLEINGCSKVTGQGWRIMKFFSPLLTGIASDTPFDMNIEIDLMQGLLSDINEDIDK